MITRKFVADILLPVYLITGVVSLLTEPWYLNWLFWAMSVVTAIAIVVCE